MNSARDTWPTPGRPTTKPTPGKPTPPPRPGCCQAISAQCFACKAGTTVDEFCKRYLAKQELDRKNNVTPNKNMPGCPRTPGRPTTKPTPGKPTPGKPTTKPTPKPNDMRRRITLGKG